MCLLVNALQDRVCMCVCVYSKIYQTFPICVRVCVGRLAFLSLFLLLLPQAGKEIQHVVRISTEEEED